MLRYLAERLRSMFVASVEIYRDLGVLRPEWRAGRCIHRLAEYRRRPVLTSESIVLA